MPSAAPAEIRDCRVDAMPTFAEAVHAHKSLVFSIAWHFLRDRSLAEELSQDVFLQLHKCWDTIESPKHMVYWLRRVTSNRCIDEVRRRDLRPEQSLTDAAEPTTLEQIQDPFLSAYLQRMVASLPEKQRMMVILRYQEDLQPEEISKMLGIKSSTVKTMLHRSMELLRSKMASRLKSDGRRSLDA